MATASMTSAEQYSWFVRGPHWEQFPEFGIKGAKAQVPQSTHCASYGQFSGLLPGDADVADVVRCSAFCALTPRRESGFREKDFGVPGVSASVEEFFSPGGFLQCFPA